MSAVLFLLTRARGREGRAKLRMGVPAMVRSKKTQSTEAQTSTTKRQYLSQSDVPSHSLDDALRVATAISEQYGKKPTSPIDVASALDIMPAAGQFRSLAGAALAYGLTDGGPNVEFIGLTDLGMQIVSPTEEGDNLAGKREALMRPRVVREFLEKYNGSPLPSETIGKNVLEQMGVPRKVTGKTLGLIISSTDSLGLLTNIKGKRLVNLKPALTTPDVRPIAKVINEDDVDEEGAISYEKPADSPASTEPPNVIQTKDALLKNRRVYISHGSNKKIVEQLKELLTYGDFEPVVSVEKETTARPVPEKLLSEMRSCGAGIIHVGPEQTIIDKDDKEHSLFNYNVLIEIGAAMALYGANYILLVEEGMELPSNLQGLYEARYKGEALDYVATMKLLRTLKEFKS